MRISCWPPCLRQNAHSAHCKNLLASRRHPAPPALRLTARHLPVPRHGCFAGVGRVRNMLASWQTVNRRPKASHDDSSTYIGFLIDNKIYMYTRRTYIARSAQPDRCDCMCHAARLISSCVVLPNGYRKKRLRPIRLVLLRDASLCCCTAIKRDRLQHDIMPTKKATNKHAINPANRPPRITKPHTPGRRSLSKN